MHAPTRKVVNVGYNLLPALLAHKVDAVLGVYRNVEGIELQQRGANALNDPAIARKLSITDEQAAKVKTILADSRTEANELFSDAGDDRQAAMQKVQALRKETNTKVMALMTEDQKKTWKEMTGEPFEVVYQPRPNN